MNATKLKDGGPAFPMPTGYVPSNGVHEWNTPKYGMTLRDYFAAKAMQARLSDYESIRSLMAEAGMRGITVAEEVAAQAYDFADAMLEARKLGSKGA